MSKLANKRSRSSHASEPMFASHGRPDSGDAFLRDPTEANPRMYSKESLAEMLGEEFVQTATSGQEAYTLDVDEAFEEEEFGGSRSTFSVEPVKNQRASTTLPEKAPRKRLNTASTSKSVHGK
jgi:hypothetical protein